MLAGVVSSRVPPGREAFVLTGVRAAIVARVSRGERSQTTRSQVEALQAVAARKGWDVTVVVEQVKSAWDTKASKDVMDKAMEPIRSGRADVLMVWCLDRLVRGGVAAAFAFVKELEEHHGASLFSLQEPFLSTATADAQTRELLLPIIAWAGKWESQRKSDRLRAKATSKKATAEKLGQRAKWGRGSMSTSADRERAHLLKGEGLTQRAIAKELGISLGAVNAILREAVPDGE